MRKFSCIFFLCICAICGNLPAQNNSASNTAYADSLKAKLNRASHDSARCRLLTSLFDFESNDSLRLVFNAELEKIAKKQLQALKANDPLRKVYQKYQGMYFLHVGSFVGDNGEVEKSEKNYRQALKIFEEINDVSSIAMVFNNLGLLYANKGNTEEALSYFEKSLKLAESSNRKSIVSTVNNNIGLVWFSQGEFTKAREYFQKHLSAQERIGNKSETALALNNIGNTYQQENDRERALDHYLKSLKILEEINDKRLLGGMYNNVGSVYSSFNERNKSIAFYKKALVLLRATDDKNGESYALHNLSLNLIETGSYAEAKKYSGESMALSKELGFPANIRNSAALLCKIGKRTNNFKDALEYYELWVKMRDSINNESTRKAAIRSQLKYEYEKQAAADSVAHAKENEVKSAELQRQSAELKAKKNQQYALFGGLFGVCVFGAFMFNRYKVTQKQKHLIELQKAEVEKQKHLVEMKQREVLDSIKYAKKIQMAQIPTHNRVNVLLMKLRSQENLK